MAVEIVLPLMKFCTRCGEKKLRSEFYTRTAGSPAITPMCRPCLRGHRAQFRAENPDKVAQSRARYYEKNKEALSRQAKNKREERRISRQNCPVAASPSTQKMCGGCKSTLPIVEFNRNAGSRDGFGYRCKSCAKIQTKKWRAENPIAAKRLSSKSRRDRNSVEGRHSKSDVDKILIYQKGRCAACAEKLREEFEVDHIIPLSKGGTDWPKNIQILCRPCNRAKYNRMPEVFMREKGYLL